MESRSEQFAADAATLDITALFNDIVGTIPGGLEAGRLLELAGRCADLAAYAEARQSEFLAAFGQARIDPEKVFTKNGEFRQSSPDAGDAGENPEPGKESSENADHGEDTQDIDDAAGIPARDLFGDALERWAGDEVACELDLAKVTGTHRLQDALFVVSLLPKCLELFKSGKLSRRRFTRLLHKASDLSAGLSGELDVVVAGWDRRISAEAFGKRIDRWIAGRRPREDEDEYKRILRERRVSLDRDGAGGATLCATGPADTLQALYQRLTATARAQKRAAQRPAVSDAGTTADSGADADAGASADSGADAVLDDQTIEQRRFDLLIGAEFATAAGVTVDGSRIRVSVTVPVMALLGEPLPGEIAGYGPIPSGMARQLAARAPWVERMLTDPITARPVDAERTKYRLSSGAKKLIRARNRTCTMPDCSSTAESCEIDHIVRWPDGQSNVANLQPVCKDHHAAKTAKRFGAEVLAAEAECPIRNGQSADSAGRPQPDRPLAPGTKEIRRRWLRQFRTHPRIIRWTLPAGRTYDAIDDSDPDAASRHADAMTHVVRRVQIAMAKQKRRRRSATLKAP